MKNRLMDLNNHLFAELERLSEEGLKGEELEQEVNRAEAIVKVSGQICKIADTTLKAAKMVVDHGERVKAMLPMLDKAPAPETSKPAIESTPQ